MEVKVWYTEKYMTSMKEIKGTKKDAQLSWIGVRKKNIVKVATLSKSNGKDQQSKKIYEVNV